MKINLAIKFNDEIANNVTEGELFNQIPLSIRIHLISSKMSFMFTEYMCKD